MAWSVATQLLNYHSFLTTKDLPHISDAKPVSQLLVAYSLSFTGRPIPPYPNYPYPGIPVQMQVEYIGPIVGMETSAVLEPIKINPHLRASTQGPTYFIVESKGFEFSLDGYRMKNIIFKGGVVAYEGGPASIQNVYLVDCEFKFKPTQEWKRLSEALFARTSLDFFQKPTS